MTENFLFLVAVLLLVESVFLILKKDQNWNHLEIAINCLLGISNIAIGLLFTDINLSIYLYFYNNYSFHLEPNNTFLSILFAVVSYDFFYYISHLVHHKCAFLWCNHFVHHSGKSYNLSTAVRIGFIGNFTVWIFFLPMACIGISLENYLIVILAQVFYQFLLHTTLIPELGFFEKILVTPSQHRVHHASNNIYLDKNFGCFFVIWDKIFRTYQREIKEIPVVYGVTTQISQEYSHGFLNFFMYVNLIISFIKETSWRKKILTIFGTPKHIKSSDFYLISYKKQISEKIIEYFIAIFIGLYLILNFKYFNKIDLITIATLFLIFSSLAGYEIHQKWIKNLSLICITLIQLLFIIYLTSSYSNYKIITFVVIILSIMLILSYTYKLTQDNS